MRSVGMCHKPNSRTPGESIKSPPAGKCSSLAAVVVCWPKPELSDTSPVSMSAPGNTLLIKLDFPTPD